MTTTIRCDIVSAEEEIFSGDVIMVVASGEMGELGIAPRHAPLITRLKPGKLVLTLPNGEKLDIVVGGGILEVQPQVVSVLADTAIRSSRPRRGEGARAKEAAERALANRGDAMDLAQAQQQLLEATVQLEAIERLRKTVRH
jgi:F-type H+-transporting ATPase subunit epsilon